MEIPLIGLGTWKLEGKQCIKVVRQALDIGYRHIDTAFAYENHKEIALALRNFDREKLFITTKLGMGQVTKKLYLSQVNDVDVIRSVEETCELALKELEVDYLDLFLIHWPDRSRPLGATLEAMRRLVETGKVRSVGVSNYTQHHLQDAYGAGLNVPFNQVEFHPYLYQKELKEFCEKHGTRLIAYRPFGKGQLLKDEPFFDIIGKKHGKTGAQVILRWIIQKNIPVIAKASSEKHLKENFNIFDFELNSLEEQNIDRLNKNFRYCAGSWNEFDY